jgi:hypothetical protein
MFLVEVGRKTHYHEKGGLFRRSHFSVATKWAKEPNGLKVWIQVDLGRLAAYMHPLLRMTLRNASRAPIHPRLLLPILPPFARAGLIFCTPARAQVDGGIARKGTLEALLHIILN